MLPAPLGWYYSRYGTAWLVFYYMATVSFQILSSFFLTMTKRQFSAGDLVFARIQGYPAWPARVTIPTSGDKYNVFFYGTYEEGTTRAEDMWPYNQKYLARFGTISSQKYREVYQEALQQIEHTPEIAVQEEEEDRVEFSVGELVFTRVKGHPVWPARVIGKISEDNYKVFFYGTSKLGYFKPSEMWPYNKKYLDRLGPLEKYKKEYRDALYQIQNWHERSALHRPDIAVQQERREFSVGDLVFARVQDYPAWPAQVTYMTSAGKYSAWIRPSYQVFLYGLCEVGRVKTGDLWPYSQEFLDKLEHVKSRKWYSEGLYQIQYTPEIATQKLKEVSDEDSHCIDVCPAIIKVSDQNSIPILINDLTIYLSTLTNESNELEMKACQGEEGRNGDQAVALSVSCINENERKDIHFVACSPENQFIVFNNNQNSCEALPSHECDEDPLEKLEGCLQAAEGILLDEDSLLDAELEQVQNEKVNLTKLEAMETLLIRKTEKLNWLKTEQRLLSLVCQIHKALLSTEGERMAKCMEMLEEIEKIDINSSMLMKVPEVFAMIKRLQIDGNLGSDDGDDIKKEIAQRSERIREKIVHQIRLGSSISPEEMIF